MNRLNQCNSIGEEPEITPESDYSTTRNIGRFTRLFGILALSATLAGCEDYSKKQEEAAAERNKEYNQQRESDLREYLPGRFEIIEDFSPKKRIDYYSPYIAAYIRDPERDICYYLQDDSRFKNTVLTMVPCEKMKAKHPDQPDKKSE
jgi:hypothetical protein